MTEAMQIPEGWHRHAGGPCPVPLDSGPAVMFGDGLINEAGAPAQFWTKGQDGDWWQHQGAPECWVIAYRPAPPQ